MNENRLPLEIIDQILEEFVNRLETETQQEEAVASRPYLKASSYTELITLRLISKTWSSAVLRFYFETISLHDSRRANVILENWKDNLSQPDFYSPVKRLSVKDLWYPKETDAADGGQEKYGESMSTLVSMDQMVKIIKLLGRNLITLHLSFTKCMAVSSDLIKAIQTIDELKSLHISEGSPRWNDRSRGTYNYDPFSELFLVIPKLEYLSTGGDYLDPSNLTPPALSNLRYFTLNPVCTETNYNIIQTAKNTLKVIEFCTRHDAGYGLGQVLKPIQETLEGFFMFEYREQLCDNISVKDLDFPNLRVFGDLDSGYCAKDSLINSWLQDPILKNVRTLVTDLSSSGSWVFDPNVTDEFTLKKGPNLKHIIFSKHPHHKYDTLDPRLVEAFKAHGIQCHVMNAMSSKELMELDLKLNGPMR